MIETEQKTNTAQRAAEYIGARYPNFHPQAAVILGSGLTPFAQTIDLIAAIDYEDLPGFPKLTVEGHQGQLLLGTLGDTALICLQGRSHSYEGLEHYHSVKTYVRTLRLLGCKYFIATNASGSLRPEVGPGELMLITDHINMQPSNPLVGPNDDAFGPRFYPLDNAYDLQMRTDLLLEAKRQDINLHQGVYLSVLGPHYETAAEIKAFRLWGADAVGMSTVPEVLVANHCGMKVAVIASITNYATGLATSSHSHEAVIAMARQASLKLNSLIKGYLSSGYLS